MKINDKVKFLKKSENSNQWQELRNDRGDTVIGIIKRLSYSRDKEPIFASVSIKQDENIFFEELVSIDSPRFKLAKA